MLSVLPESWLSSTTRIRMLGATADLAAGDGVFSPDRCRRGHRQANDKLASFAGAFALRIDRAAVQLDEPPHERQPDAQSALGSFQRPIDLSEHVEHVRQRFARNADAVVANDDHDVRSVQLRLDLDPAARRPCTWRCCSTGWKKPGPSASDRHSR